jgi:hypothetical protein
MSHFGTNTQLETDLLARVDCQHLGLASRGKGSLVAPNVRAIRGRSIAEISRGVGRELDRVVLDRAGGLADVFESRLLDASDDVGVEKVVGGGHLGTSAENKGGELHADRAVMNV